MTRRPSRRQRATAARVAAERAAVWSAEQVDTADAREQVPADVRAVADGYRKPKRRDTSRRCIAVTGSAWPDHYPANVDRDGAVSADAQRGYAAADARRWRGEARAVSSTPAATDARLYLPAQGGLSLPE